MRGEGRPDSRGHFTLDRYRAQALLGQFQKGNPKHYLFHIVRAGGAARSRKIVVLSEQDRLEVRFEGPAPLAFEQRLMKSLESPWGLPQGSALAHLARGILASTELRPHRMEWNTWDGSRGSQLLWDESGLRGQPQARPSERILLCLVGGQSRSAGSRGSASAVAVGWHLHGDGRVIWVQNGLRLSELFLDMGCPGSVAVSEVDGLTLDAGGTQIVDDRVYRHRVRDLRESIKTLWPTIPKYLPLLQFKAASESGFLSRLFQSPERNLTSQEKALQAEIRARLPRYQL